MWVRESPRVLPGDFRVDFFQQIILQFLQEGRSHDVKLGGATLAIGQGRGRMPRARCFVPRGRSLERVALPGFGGLGNSPENFSNSLSKLRPQILVYIYGRTVVILYCLIRDFVKMTSESLG
jgi:hypothetical protein